MPLLFSLFPLLFIVFLFDPVLIILRTGQNGKVKVKIESERKYNISDTYKMFMAIGYSSGTVLLDIRVVSTCDLTLHTYLNRKLSRKMRKREP